VPLPHDWVLITHTPVSELSTEEKNKNRWRRGVERNRKGERVSDGKRERLRGREREREHILVLGRERGKKEMYIFWC
jgi:hypothetical protein